MESVATTVMWNLQHMTVQYKRQNRDAIKAAVDQRKTIIFPRLPGDLHSVFKITGYSLEQDMWRITNNNMLGRKIEKKLARWWKQQYTSKQLSVYRQKDSA